MVLINSKLFHQWGRFCEARQRWMDAKHHLLWRLYRWAATCRRKHTNFNLKLYRTEYDHQSHLHNEKNARNLDSMDHLYCWLEIPENTVLGRGNVYATYRVGWLTELGNVQSLCFSHHIIFSAFTLERLVEEFILFIVPEGWSPAWRGRHGMVAFHHTGNRKQEMVPGSKPS